MYKQERSFQQERLSWQIHSIFLIGTLGNANALEHLMSLEEIFEHGIHNIVQQQQQKTMS